MNVRSPSLAVAFLTLCTVASAQHGLPGPAAPPIADDNLSSLIVGEFSGNTHNDAVVLANGKPVLREGVETYQTYIVADIVGNDIATLHGTGVGGRDQFVLVGSGGLSLLELRDDWTNGPWEVDPLRTGSYWTSASTVRVGQVDGNFGEDIVAVTSNRVVIALSDGDGGWQSDVSFLVGSNVTGLELVDWDGNDSGALELAVLIGSNSTGPARIRIVQQTGAYISIITGGDKVIASPFGSTEEPAKPCLAAIATTVSTGEQTLAVVSKYGSSGPWTLGTMGVVHTAAGDWNGDSIDELLVSTTTSRDALGFVGVVGGGAHYTLHPGLNDLVLPLGHPSRPLSVQDADLDVIDVDMDGDLDFVSGVQGTFNGTPWDYEDATFSAVQVTWNTRVHASDYTPWHAPGTEWPLQVPPLKFDSAAGTLTVPLLRPKTVLDGAQLEYAVWRTPSIEALALPDPIVLLDDAPIAEFIEGELTWTNVTLDLQQHESIFPDRYTLIVRQVVHDPNDPAIILDESPALKVTFFSMLHGPTHKSHWQVQTVDPALNIIKPEEPPGGTSGTPLPPTGANQRP